MTSSMIPGNDFTLAVHGGAGTILRSKMTPEQEAVYHAGLRRALESRAVVLADGGDALDAATAAVMALEDEPLFNAGRGAVCTSAGKQEMDAAVMDGPIVPPALPASAAHAIRSRRASRNGAFRTPFC